MKQENIQEKSADSLEIAKLITFLSDDPEEHKLNELFHKDPQRFVFSDLILDSAPYYALSIKDLASLERYYLVLPKSCLDLPHITPSIIEANKEAENRSPGLRRTSPYHSYNPPLNYKQKEELRKENLEEKVEVPANFLELTKDIIKKTACIFPGTPFLIPSASRITRDLHQKYGLYGDFEKINGDKRPFLNSFFFLSSFFQAMFTFTLIPTSLSIGYENNLTKETLTTLITTNLLSGVYELYRSKKSKENNIEDIFYQQNK